MTAPVDVHHRVAIPRAAVHMVLKSLENLLTKSTDEGAYKNYDMVVPWKNAAWDDVWSEFV